MRDSAITFQNPHEMYTLLSYYPNINDILSQVYKTDQGYILWFKQISEQQMIWILNVTETSRLKDKIIEIRSGHLLNRNITVTKVTREYDIQTNLITVKLVPHSTISVEEDRLFTPQ